MLHLAPPVGRVGVEGEGLYGHNFCPCQERTLQEVDLYPLTPAGRLNEHIVAHMYQTVIEKVMSEH